MNVLMNLLKPWIGPVSLRSILRQHLLTVWNIHNTQTYSVVTTTKLSPPPRWLATTEPTPPSRCFTACSAVFLDAVSWKLPLTSAASFDPCMNENARRDQLAAIPPAGFPTGKRQDCPDSRDSLGTVLCETVATFSLSAPSTVACSEQLAHSRRTKPRHPPVSN